MDKTPSQAFGSAAADTLQSNPDLGFSFALGLRGTDDAAKQKTVRAVCATFGGVITRANLGPGFAPQDMNVVLPIGATQALARHPEVVLFRLDAAVTPDGHMDASELTDGGTKMGRLVRVRTRVPYAPSQLTICEDW
jgi:hypothetical protein